MENQNLTSINEVELTPTSNLSQRFSILSSLITPILTSSNKPTSTTPSECNNENSIATDPSNNSQRTSLANTSTFSSTDNNNNNNFQPTKNCTNNHEQDSKFLHTNPQLFEHIAAAKLIRASSKPGQNKKVICFPGQEEFAQLQVQEEKMFKLRNSVHVFDAEQLKKISKGGTPNTTHSKKFRSRTLSGNKDNSFDSSSGSDEFDDEKNKMASPKLTNSSSNSSFEHFPNENDAFEKYKVNQAFEKTNESSKIPTDAFDKFLNLNENMRLRDAKLQEDQRSVLQLPTTPTVKDKRNLLKSQQRMGFDLSDEENSDDKPANLHIHRDSCFGAATTTLPILEAQTNNDNVQTKKTRRATVTGESKPHQPNFCHRSQMVGCVKKSGWMTYKRKILTAPSIDSTTTTEISAESQKTDQN